MKKLREIVPGARIAAGARTVEHSYFHGVEVRELDREELLYLIYILGEERRFAESTLKKIEEMQRTPWVMFPNRPRV